MTIINIFSVILFIAFGALVLRKKSKGPLLLFFYLSQLWAVLSSFYIETGIYITEQNRYSFETGATTKLVLFNIIFFLGVLLVTKVKWRPLTTIYVKELDIKYKSNIILIVCTLTILLNFFNSLITYILFNEQYNRFNFVEFSVMPFLQPLFNQIILVLLLLGVVLVYFIENKVQKRFILIAYLNLALVILSFILQNHKFTPLYLSLLFFFIPYLITFKVDYKRIVKFLLIISVFVIIVLSLAFYEYTNYRGFTSFEAIDFIIYRIFGLQAHVWWGTDAFLNTLPNAHFYKQFSMEIKSIFTTINNSGSVGMESLMLFLSGDLARHYIDSGVSFTNGFPAILLFIFGQGLSLPIIFVLGILLGVLITAFEHFIKTKQIIPILIFSKLYIDSFRLYAMGNVNEFISLRNITLLVVVLIYTVILAAISNKKHEELKSFGYS